MELVEVFYSIQGEGRFVGEPSIFIRFGGCNLRCKGFGEKEIDGFGIFNGCDTIRAVYGDFKKNWHKIESIKDILNKVVIFEESIKFLPNIVITGGEPLLNWKNPIFLELLEYFLGQNRQITIETNATIEIDFEKYPIYKRIVFAMGVKLSNSLEQYNKRINQKAFLAIAQNTTNSFFKFVISAQDIEGCEGEIEQVLQDLRRVNLKIPVFCMPLGDSRERLARNDEAVIEFCKKKGYNYSDRLHIRLWNRREAV